jgi:hypothetical protein
VRITSRILTTEERRRRRWPLLERWVAYAVLPDGGRTSAYGLTRRGAEFTVVRQAEELVRAGETQRTTTR